MFTAVESQSGIFKAYQDWIAKFAVNSQAFMYEGEPGYWHPQLGLAGFFHRKTSDDKPIGYWNAFARTNLSFRSNLVVQINPPAEGINSNVQGLIGRDENGHRWILHNGRLHPGKVRITEEMFDAASALKRLPVRFSQGKPGSYLAVANLDAPAAELQLQMSSFVEECARLRLFYQFGKDEADAEKAVLDAEQQLSRENMHSYEVNREASTVIVTPLHAKIMNALVDAFEILKIPHSNGRVGRWGPDLRTMGDDRVLIEIKCTTLAHDIQRATGQLCLYERLLGKSYRKVLVVPAFPPKSLMDALGHLGIQILPYTKKGQRISFPTEDLLAVCRAVRR